MAIAYYENDRFRVIDVEYNDPILDEVVEGYGIQRIANDVVEGECRRYYIAKIMADKFNDDEASLEDEADQNQLDLLRKLEPANTEAV